MYASLKERVIRVRDYVPARWHLLRCWVTKYQKFGWAAEQVLLRLDLFERGLCTIARVRARCRLVVRSVASSRRSSQPAEIRSRASRRQADQMSIASSQASRRTEVYSELAEEDEWTAIQKFNTLLHYEEQKQAMLRE